MQERAIIYIVCILGCLDISIAHSRSERANGVSDVLPQSSIDPKARKTLHMYIENTHSSLKADLDKQCWDRGVSQPYPNYYTVLKNVTACVKSEANFTLDLDQLWLELTFAGPQNAWKEMLEKTCPSWDAIEACSRPAAESFNVCYDASELKAMKTARNISRAIIDYVCKDNGAQLLAFIDDRECLARSTRPALDCASKLDLPPQNRRNGNQKAENDFIAFMKFENDQCSQTQLIRDCARKELEKCNNRASVNFMDDLIQAAMAPPCSGTSGSWMISNTLVSIVTVILAYVTFT